MKGVYNSISLILTKEFPKYSEGKLKEIQEWKKRGLYVVFECKHGVELRVEWRTLLARVMTYI